MNARCTSATASASALELGWSAVAPYAWPQARGKNSNETGFYKEFLLSGLSGFYFSVEQEGEVEVGDSFELISTRARHAITIAEMNCLYFHEKYNQALLKKAIDSPALPEDWREYFLPRLNGPATHA